MQAGKGQQTGFTYLVLLFSIAILSVGLSTTGVIWSTESRLAKQRETEFIGQEFVRAIESYYYATPGEVKSYPQTLDDLVKDTRFLFTRRHLRKIYPDPFTQQKDWELIKLPQGGIIGVASAINPSGIEKKKAYVFTPILLLEDATEK